MSTNGNGFSVNGGPASYQAEPMYSFAEASRYADVSRGTVRNWLLGYEAKDRKASPLFTPSEEQGPMVSFLQLIEIIVAAKFRKAQHKPYKVVYAAYRNAKGLFHIEYPFAHLRLETLGGHIVHILEEGPTAGYQAMDQPEVRSLPRFAIPEQPLPGGPVLELVHQLDYEDELARRWYPIGKSIPIVLDPTVSAGLPTIEHRGVTVDILLRRWRVAKQSIDFMARDFELDREVIESALQFADRIGKAAA